MGKRANGGVLGVVNTPTTNKASGLWSLAEVALYKKAGTWPSIATFALSVDSATVNKGGSFTVTLTTTGVADGTLVPYTITGIAAEDLSSGSLTGNFTVSSNTGSLTFTTASSGGTSGDLTATFSCGGDTETITFQEGDTYFKYVTALLHGDGTNAANNNTFTDSSSNAFTITRNGDTTQGTFTPYGDTWSNYFATTVETGLYNTSAALLSTSASTFTMEAWMCMTTDPVNVGEAGSHGSIVTPNGAYNTSEVYMSFGPMSTRKLTLQWFDGSSKNATYDTALNLNQWYHVAVVVNAGAISMYVDGTAVTLTGTTTLTNRNGTSGKFCVGGSGQYQFGGYLSNVRVTNTVVYSSNFTPSTSNLTAVTGTLLLTCQNNRFKDNSSNSYTLTPFGSPSVQKFSPFSPTAAYSTSGLGGSAYFDGSGDYLSLASNSALDLGTDAFTIEFWVNCATQDALYPTAIGSFAGSWGSGAVACHIDHSSTANKAGLHMNGNETPVVSSTSNVCNSEWNHIAFTRTANTWRCFVNGVLEATNTSRTDSVNLSTSGTSIGRDGWNSSNGYFKGYLCDVRVLKGTCLYTTSFTPPSAPLGNISTTSLLTNFTNGGIIDNAMMNDWQTVGNAQISTSVKKYGTGSIAFDGTGDYLTASSSPNLALGTGDFTFECWCYPTSSSSFRYIFSIGGDSNFACALNSGTYTPYFYAGSTILTSSQSLNANQWNHVALVRNNGTLAIYVNGVSGGTASFSTSIAAGIGYVAAQSTGSYAFTGYIDDLRITKGYARYTSNFTAPTGPFQDR